MSMALDIAAKNVKQSAEFLGVTIGRIYELIRDGRLKATKVSERCWLVETDSLERYAAGDRSPGRRSVQKS
jgi:excisionase family DNA binding protein